jgi:hypothetical protein
MSDEPGNTEFGVDDQAVQDFTATFSGDFPAALLAPVWRALLQKGVVVAPVRGAVDQAEVVLLDPGTLELRVPISTVSGLLVKSVTVSVRQWPHCGELATELTDAAERLAGVLETVDANVTFDYVRGPSQKPHN